jgi:hypothetical protein
MIFDAKQNEDDKFAFTNHYFHTISRKIKLQDGRNLVCKVPLKYPALSEDEHKTKPKRNLTAEQAEMIFMHFKDLCATTRTKVFLWEICHKKHGKQYDDATTIMNAQKQQAELFYLGWYNDEGDDRFSLTKELNVEPDKRKYFIKYDKILLTDGNIVKFINYASLSTISQHKPYALSIYVPLKEVENIPDLILDVTGKTLKTYKDEEGLSARIKMIHGEKHVKIDRKISKFISSSIVFIATPFPFDMITSDFTIIDVPPSPGDNRMFIDNILDVNEVKIQGKYLYGKKGRFLMKIEDGDNVIIRASDTEFLSRRVKKIWDDNLLELDSEIPQLTNGIVSDYHFFHSYNNQICWNVGKGVMSMYGNVVFGKGTQYRKYKPGDIVAGFSEKEIEEQNVFTIKKIISDTLMVVDDQLKYAEIYDYQGQFLVGSTTCERRDLLSRTQRKNYIKTEETESFAPNLMLPASIAFDKKKPLKDKIICHDQFRMPNNNSWVLRFKLKKLNPSKSNNLRLYLTEKNCKRDNIELTLINLEQVLMTYVGVKSNFTASSLVKDINSTTQKFEDTNIWISYHNGIVRMGYSFTVRLSNQLIEFKVDPFIGLEYFSFDYRESFNIEIIELEALRINKDLGYTFNVMEHIPSFEDVDVTYFELYDKGSWCAPIKAGRSFDLEYHCSATNEFFAIEDIYEPRTCHYHITVGTSLLCPKKSNMDKFQASTINCMISDEQ